MNNSLKRGIPEHLRGLVRCHWFYADDPAKRCKKPPTYMYGALNGFWPPRFYCTIHAKRIHQNCETRKPFNGQGGPRNKLRPDEADTILHLIDNGYAVRAIMRATGRSRSAICRLRDRRLSAIVPDDV